MTPPAAPAPNLARIRLILWGLVLLAGIAATLVFVFRAPTGPLAVTGEPFALEATTGKAFSEQDLKGTPSLVFFGYTFCPDVCPTTMAEATAWRQQLALSPEQLRIIFVTVDPARDTLPKVTEYLAGFDPSIIGLVGSEEQTAAIQRAFGASSERAEADGDEFYLVNHTASVFLVDAQGRFQSTIGYGEAMPNALAKIKRLIGA